MNIQETASEAENAQSTVVAGKKQSRKRQFRLSVIIAGGIVVAVGALLYWLHARQFVETEVLAF